MIPVIIVIIVTTLLLLARKSKPANSKNGQGLQNFPAVAQDQVPPSADQQHAILKVATFNIQTGKDLNGKRHLLGSAEVMAQADIVGVQEVYAPSLFNIAGTGLSQTHAVAKYGGFGWLFSATRRRWLREHRGNALLSKVPVSNWSVKMLSDESGKSFRNMTVAEVQWQGRQFHFINTHLHTRGGRETQLLEVLQEFAKYPTAILLGDFNSRVSTPALNTALKDIEISDAITLAKLDMENPDRIDWILTKGFNIEGGKMLEKGVSDHPYYQVNLSYKDLTFFNLQ
jgi:endonuclease/exonuclease/phosphatase family metal-dependent hydrolase